MLVFTGRKNPRGTLSRLKHHYGPREEELARYAQRAGDGGNPALLILCERRLENVLRRAGFTRSRLDARRAICHGHILVNGRKMIHPSYLVQVGDVLSVRRQPRIQAQYRFPLAAATPPHWLQVTPAEYRANVIRLPAEADVELAVDPAGVVEEVLSHTHAEAIP